MPGKKGFTLMELLAVMAILAVLAAMVAPAVTGTKEASVDAKVFQDATQVRNASASYFKDQHASEVITPHSVITSTLISGASVGSIATQKVSSRWPEKYITLQSGSTDAAVTAVGALYAEEIDTAPDRSVKLVTLQDTEGRLISGLDFLQTFTAIDLELLQSGNYLAKLPDSARPLSNGNIDNFLWLFAKKSSSRTTQDDDRAVSVFKLVKVEKLESQTTGGGIQKVQLTYRMVVGSPPPNKPPIALAQAINTLEDTPVAVLLQGEDQNGDILTFAVVGGPSHGTLTGTGASRTYAPSTNFNGLDSFTFKVSDGKLDSGTATVSITVTPGNDAPVANTQSVGTPEDTAKAITLTGSDVDGDSLTFAIVTSPAHGTLTGSGAARTYTPNANFNGADSFTFKVNDGTVDSNIATVSITVTAVNDAPVANGQSVSTEKDTAKVITLTGSDVDGDTLTFNIVTQAMHGTLTGSGATRTYTPNLNFSGADSFTFRVNDGLADSNTATVSITVVAIGTGVWSTKAPMPTARHALSLGANNGIIYAAGGWNSFHRTAVEAYDTGTNTWALKASMIGPQTDAASGVINGVLYLAGGTNCCVETNTFTAYDIAANAWMAKPNMPTIRQGAVGGVINGKLYVAGGINTQNQPNQPPLSTLEVFDPVTNAWSSLSQMPTARYISGGGVVNGIFYVVGGRTFSGTPLAPVQTVEAYNPATDTWITKAPMPTAREYPAVAVLNGILYVMGGIGSGGEFLTTVEAYDPATDTWTTMPSMPTARGYFRAEAVGGRVYAIGGEGVSGTLSVNEAFTPTPSVSFFLSPGSSPNGDLAWQSAVGAFTEFNLDGFAAGQLVKTLTAGPITITIGPAPGGQEIFFGGFTGGVYGTVSGGTFINRDGVTFTNGLTFSFSQPVKGFGLWIFDDGQCCPNSSVMTVTEVGGASVTSGILDANPGGTAHTVEGFLGATSLVGITSVTINLGLGGVFEVDHLQVGGPAP